MTDKQELKSCPFCGKTPEVTTRDVEPQGDTWYGRKDETFVLCDCGACLFEGNFHEGFGAPERAIAAWNARPADPLTAELVEALEKIATAMETTPQIGYVEGKWWSARSEAISLARAVLAKVNSKAGKEATR